jgi:hypothetical protein
VAGGDREVVDRRELRDVIGEEGAPRLGRATRATPEILRHGGLCQIDAELLQLTVDARRTPEWVGSPHLANQRTNVRGQRRPADATRSRLPAPIGGERAPMPTHHGGGRDDLDRLPPLWPDGREHHPEQAIDRPEARSFRGGPLEHGKLMPENFGRELEPRAGRGREARPTRR